MLESDMLSKITALTGVSSRLPPDTPDLKCPSPGGTDAPWGSGSRHGDHRAAPNPGFRRIRGVPGYVGRKPAGHRPAT